MKITVHRGTKEVGGSCIPSAEAAVQAGGNISCVVPNHKSLEPLPIY